MNKILLFSLLLVSFFTIAQVPQGISYQAIALNGSGTAVVSSTVRVKLSVLDVSAIGSVIYSETHLKTTNPQGLFNLTIGQGTVISGVFASINWGINSKFLKVEMDATGGTAYVTVGTTQLLSVPYALAAGSLSGSSANESIEENKYANFAFADNGQSKVYAFNSNTSTWVMQNGYAGTTLISSNGNFAFADNGQSEVYVFNKITGTWVMQNGYAGTTLVTSNGNFAFADNGQSEVYAFNKTTGTWVIQNGYAGTTLVSSNGNFAFADNGQSKVYAFNKTTGTWVMQNGYAGATLVSSNGNFAFTDNGQNKVYTFNKNTGTWVMQNGYAGTTLISSPSN
ncbi:hypothetical protein [Flavobacterium sp.]|uniref:hypothetical protein n=1 Tax=Flavobacterium sp. TaxID=239 RepID=UPI002487A6AA|nr:hypothetical protein [Flavobacterium sp.]MDI1316917.1 hypothetical protein [Flavobacterium sp.]